MKGKMNENQNLEMVENQNTEKGIIRELIEVILYIIFVCFVVWFMINYVGQRTEVSGDSMYDTLEDGDNLWIDKLSYRFKNPERFDIVVFPYKDQSVYYIKRIIGLPGETVKIEEDGTILINQKPLEEDYGYEVILPEMIGLAKNEIQLGEDEYFVLGDNRNASCDSRFEDVGTIKGKTFEGRAVVRIWPFSKFGLLD